MESMSWPLTPKSHSLISPRELTRMLEGLTSADKQSRRCVQGHVGGQETPAPPAIRRRSNSCSHPDVKEVSVGIRTLTHQRLFTPADPPGSPERTPRCCWPEFDGERSVSADRR